MATKFHTISGIAKMLNLSVTTVWKYVQSGRLSAHKIGGTCWRIPDEALQKFLNDSQYVEGAATK